MTTYFRVTNFDDLQHYKDRSPPWFLYVNAAAYHGGEIAKIGYSNNPEKRILAFNNGLRHRHRNGYLPTEVTFSRFFTVKVSSRSACKRIEREILSRFKNLVLKEFGVEVVDLPAEVVALSLCKAAEAAHA